MVFLLAGYETTATALMYITYELALNPDIQDRLFEEVNGAVDAKGEISYEVLAKLPYLDALLSETLRLHSPTISLGRMASTDYKLGNTGLTVEKGTIIQIPHLSMHLSEEYYPEPYKFDPDRFMPENRHKLVPYTYLPFGAGPRNCIGMRFALMEAKLGLAHIARRYRFFPTSQTDVPLILKKSILNTPKRIIVGIERR
jgi:cytochrome P450